MGVRSASVNTYERDIFMVSLFFCPIPSLSLQHNLLYLSPLPSLPLSFSPPYIYVQYFTQSCVNIQLIYRRSYLIYRHYLSISLVLSIYLISPLISYLISIIFIINISYIYLYPISYIPMIIYVLYLL